MPEQNTRHRCCTLYIVRHGETEWNAKDVVLGQKDSPLTELGISQALRVAEELKRVAFDAIFSSDSWRAQRTAEIIKLDRELTIRTSELLRERSYGHWEGQPFSEYRKSIKKVYERSLRLPEEEQWRLRMDHDVESDGEIVARFIRQLREIVIGFFGKTILVVTHGGCIRAFLMQVGYARRSQLTMESFKNGGYIKVLSYGVDFMIKDVEGLTLKTE